MIFVQRQQMAGCTEMGQAADRTRTRLFALAAISARVERLSRRVERWPSGLRRTLGKRV